MNGGFLFFVKSSLAIKTKKMYHNLCCMSNKSIIFNSDFIILLVWNVLCIQAVDLIDKTHEIDGKKLSIRPHLKDNVCVEEPKITQE